MDDYRNLFERELKKLNYLYVKANTKSKKRQMAYDLIFFEDMYNGLSGEKTVFPWTNDEIFISVRYEVARDIVQSVLDDQQFIIKLVEKSFNIFLESEFSVYCDYGKKYHRISDALVQRTMVDVFDTIDENIKFRFRDKFDNSELFINNTMSKHAGLFFPMESLGKNVILVASEDERSVEEGRILTHEMGHDFEFDNASKNGVISIWNGIVRTIYPEVSSCFFEYAYINYLIENNIHKEDAMMLKRRYLDQIYYFFCYLLIIFSHRDLKIDPYFNITLNNKEIVDYANELLEKMNSSDDMFKIGDKLSFRTPFVYGIDKLLGIYVYDFYKKNPKEFLSNFKMALLQYKNIGLEAFSILDITRESLLDGELLRRTLKDCK